MIAKEKIKIVSAVFSSIVAQGLPLVADTVACTIATDLDINDTETTFQ